MNRLSPPLPGEDREKLARELQKDVIATRKVLAERGDTAPLAMLDRVEQAIALLTYPRAAIGEETLRTALERVRDDLGAHARPHSLAAEMRDVARDALAALSSAPSSIPEDDGKLIEDLKRDARSYSEASRMAAEAKSARQADKDDYPDIPGGYDYLRPEQTNSWKAATRIETLSRENERLRAIIAEAKAKARLVIEMDGDMGGWWARLRDEIDQGLAQIPANDTSTGSTAFGKDKQ